MSRPYNEVRRPEIIKAAYDAISRHGLPTVSYDQIAAEAGLSRQLIRHYFPKPEMLMEGVCDYLVATYRDCLSKGIIAAGHSERLTVLLDFYFDFLAGAGIPKPRDDSVYDALFALAATQQSIRDNLCGQYTLLQTVISHEIQISHPKLKQSACSELGFLFVALMYGHWKMVASLGLSSGHNRVTRAAIDRLIQSYLERYDDPDDTPLGASRPA
jgi:AcrR family transcriptional regulator